MKLSIPTNPQVYQTIFLMIVLNLGINFYGLYFDYTKFFVVFLSCIWFDIIYTKLITWNWRWPYSGINAGFWISFFLRTDILALYILAAFFAISSKHLFRVNGKHFLNPSNFWSFSLLVLFPQITWTNPLQWWKINEGNIWYYGILALILTLWFLIIWRVRISIKKNLLWLVLPFMGVHLLAYLTFGDVGSWISFTKWYSPAFFVFTFFMLTDPQITPDNNWSKWLFAANTAILIYLLQFFINENYSTLASLFLMTLTLPIIHKLDLYNFYKKCTYGNMFYIALFFIILILLVISIQVIGPIDLVFDNRCRQLLCM